MFSPGGPTLRQLTVQALSSTERGYDLLAPRFDRTPFRTPEPLLDAVGRALRPLGPFRSGLDVCCGTGAGLGVLTELCTAGPGSGAAAPVVGVDFSAGMLAEARRAYPAGRVALVRADARALPFAPVFDLAVSFGAFGHFLPRERAGLFAQVAAALRPGGRFAFPVVRPPRVGSPGYLLLGAFDAAMRVRNALLRPPFVMYYRTFRLPDVLADLHRTGFTVEFRPLPEFADRARLLVATRV